MDINFDFAVVEVHWKDSCNTGDWRSVEEAKKVKPLEVVSLGYLIDNTEEAVILAHGISEEGAVLSIEPIPAACVFQIVTLRKKEKE